MSEKPVTFTSDQYLRREIIQSIGIQSEIDMGEANGVKIVHKLSGMGLPKETVHDLYLTTITFRKHLEENGLVLAKNFLLRETSAIETFDEYIDGEDLDVQIKKGQNLEGWSQMITTLFHLNSGKNESKLMIDAKPANWIYKNNTLYYVDLYPPTLRDEEGMITPWVFSIYKRSRRLFTFNYGDTRGQITKMLALAKLSYPTRFEEIKNITLDLVKQSNLSQNAIEYIVAQTQNSFPDMTLFYANPEQGEERLKELLGR